MGIVNTGAMDEARWITSEIFWERDRAKRLLDWGTSAELFYARQAADSIKARTPLNFQNNVNFGRSLSR